MADIQFDHLDFSKHYTYADYLTWKFQERVELIVGKIFKMSPAPSTEHQEIVSALHGNIYQFLRAKKCKVFPGPFDVILPSPSGVEDTVVQPDISVVCDPAKIKAQGCYGPPDMIIEVVSKSSIKKDLHEKYELYERVGVKEYWIVHPHERSLMIFIRNEQGIYQPTKPLTKGDVATSGVLPGLHIELNEIFSDGVEEPEVEYARPIN